MKNYLIIYNECGEEDLKKKNKRFNNLEELKNYVNKMNEEEEYVDRIYEKNGNEYKVIWDWFVKRNYN